MLNGTNEVIKDSLGRANLANTGALSNGGAGDRTTGRTLDAFEDSPSQACEVTTEEGNNKIKNTIRDFGFSS